MFFDILFSLLTFHASKNVKKRKSRSNFFSKTQNLILGKLFYPFKAFNWIYRIDLLLNQLVVGPIAPTLTWWNYYKRKHEWKFWFCLFRHQRNWQNEQDWQNFTEKCIPRFMPKLSFLSQKCRKLSLYCDTPVKRMLGFSDASCCECKSKVLNNQLLFIITS